jgi:hypothetical protein
VSDLNSISRRKSRQDSVLLEPDTPVDLNSFATKKTASAGALGTGLISSNADQLKKVLSKDPMSTFDYVKMAFIIASLVLQIINVSCYIYLGASGNITKNKKKRMSRINNICMVMSFLITVLNIFIPVFNDD